MEPKKIGKRPKRLVLISVVSAGLFLMFQNFSYPADGEFLQPARTTKIRFVWPMDGWIQATDYYRNGSYHGAVADISASHFTPVFATRAGTVSKVSKSVKGGLGVYITHDGGYRSVYTHLAMPLVKKNQQVRQGEMIGYSGRYGNAVSPHLHFSLLKNEKVVPVPNLKRGAWVRAGSSIPLGVTDVPAQTGLYSYYLVRASESVYTSDTASRTKSKSYMVAGRNYVVVNSYKGYLRVRMPDGNLQYVPRNMVGSPSSMAMPVMTKTAAALYDPKTRDHYDTLKSEFSLTRYRDPSCEKDGFACVLHRRSGDSQVDLRMVSLSDIRSSPTSFVTYFFAPETPLRTGPGNHYQLLQVVADPAGLGQVRVLDVKDGWYQIRFKNRLVWTHGWRTGGAR